VFLHPFGDQRIEHAFERGAFLQGPRRGRTPPAPSPPTVERDLGRVVTALEEPFLCSNVDQPFGLIGENQSRSSERATTTSFSLEARAPCWMNGAATATKAHRRRLARSGEKNDGGSGRRRSPKSRSPARDQSEATAAAATTAVAVGSGRRRELGGGCLGVSGRTQRSGPVDVIVLFRRVREGGRGSGRCRYGRPDLVEPLSRARMPRQ